MKRKYKKLRYHHFLWVFRFLIVLIMLLLFTIALGKWFHLKWTITIIGIGVLLLIVTVLANRDIIKMAYHIENFNKSNNFLQYELSNRGKNIVTYYPDVQYKKENGVLYLKWRLDGSIIGEKLEKLEKPLSHFLKSRCEEVIDEKGYKTYVLSQKDYPQDIIYDFSELPQLEMGKIQVGNQQISWLDCPHILISGMTQSGKSTLSKILMYQLRKQGVRINYFDPKGSAKMRNFCKANDIKYFSDLEEIATALKEVDAEMRVRGQDLEKIHIKEFEFSTTIYNFFDEMIAYQKLVDSKKYKEVEGYISSIITQGAEKGVMFCAILQRSDTSYIEGAIRDQFGIRVAMGHPNEVLVKMMFPDTPDVKNYRTEKGSGLIYREGIDKMPKELIIPYIINS